MSAIEDYTDTTREVLWSADSLIDKAMESVPNVRFSPQLHTSEDITDDIQFSPRKVTPPSYDSGHRRMTTYERAKNFMKLETTRANLDFPLIGVPEEKTIFAWVSHYPIPWKLEIDIAQEHEEIIALLRLFGLKAVADRLIYLRGLSYDDPEEPTIEVESLRSMAHFLMSERQLPVPQIGVTPTGLIQIEWRFQNNGILAMEFLMSGQIRFAAISAPTQRGFEPQRVNGTLLKDEVLEAVRSFTQLI